MEKPVEPLQRLHEELRLEKLKEEIGTLEVDIRLILEQLSF